MKIVRGKLFLGSGNVVFASASDRYVVERDVETWTQIPSHILNCRLRKLSEQTHSRRHVLPAQVRTRWCWSDIFIPFRRENNHKPECRRRVDIIVHQVDLDLFFFFFFAIIYLTMERRASPEEIMLFSFSQVDSMRQDAAAANTYAYKSIFMNSSQWCMTTDEQLRLQLNSRQCGARMWRLLFITLSYSKSGSTYYANHTFHMTHSCSVEQKIVFNIQRTAKGAKGELLLCGTRMFFAPVELMGHL